MGGVFLFNATIDDLEEGCGELPETRRSIRRWPYAVLSTPKASSTNFNGMNDPLESPIVAVRPKKGRKRLNYTNELLEELPEEPNHWTEARWKMALALLLRFIDDGFCLSKVNQ